MLGRRQFMSMIGSLGLGVLFTKNLSVALPAPAAATIDYYPYLLAVMEEQGRHWGCELDSTEKTSLAYACKNIRPATHVELAAVVAMGVGSLLRTISLVDEYIHRRSGMMPLYPDHPLLELSKYGTPSTYRVMIYREQLLALIRELTDCSLPKSIARLRSYQFDKNIEPLHEISTTKYRKLLTDEEFRLLDRILRDHARYVKPYSLCSTLASRAETMAREEMAALS